MAVTAAGLLGIKLPGECVGTFAYQAFEPVSDIKYVPIPSIRPSEETLIERVYLSISEK